VTARFTCSGRSGAAEQDCTFATDDEGEAFTHFEEFDHDVEAADLPNLLNEFAGVETKKVPYDRRPDEG
jgi:hypothetical protein